MVVVPNLVRVLKCSGYVVLPDQSGLRSQWEETWDVFPELEFTLTRAKIEVPFHMYEFRHFCRTRVSDPHGHS